MANGNFVSYLRVSTARQGVSGLGLEAQRESVARYLNGGNWTLIEEVTETESGKRHGNRPRLEEALRLCRVHRATLIIAKLDRLARNVHFISSLMEANIEFVACDLPQANRLTVHILAAVAEHEAGMISTRTREALAAAKARGVVLGGLRCSRDHMQAIGAKGRATSHAVRAESVRRRHDDIRPIIQEVREGGAVSLRQIAAALNERGVPTARGGRWSAPQVQRVIAA